MSPSPSPNDPLTACDRLVALFDRARALGEERIRAAAIDDTIRAPVVPFVIAQLRMRIGPALRPDWSACDPVHVALVGGTNTGKSTVVNLLLGRAGAAMGARARLSQHPAAYRPAALGDRWLDAFPGRFAGYRRYRDEAPPRQSDEELRRDGYRPALAVLDPDRAPIPALGPPATASAVCWDVPDFSTEEGQIYLGTILDVAALADLVIMVVSDESYADQRGHELLRMLADSGVTILVAANKLPESPKLREDLAETLGANGRFHAGIHHLPQVRGTDPQERLGNLLTTPEAAAFRAAIAREASRGAELKRQALRGAVGFIDRHMDEALRPLADEADRAARWADRVGRITAEHVLEPYRRDYLEGVRYGEFNRTLVHVMGLLQVPWIGPVVDLAGKVVRAPVRLATGLVRRLARAREEAPKLPPEQEVLGEAVATWLAALKAEAQALAGAEPHPAWAEIVRRFDDETFRRDLLARFDDGFQSYRKDLEETVRHRASAIFRKLEEDPKRLNALRGANLAANLLAVALVIKSWGIDWSDAVVGPVVAGLWQNLLEWGLGRYLETQRAGLLHEQLEAMRGLVEVRLAEPARALFRGAVRVEDLRAARRDFARIREAVGRLAGAEAGRGAR
ncbi:MAG TPA: GTPase domain-containing protein [Isosphaeraceae bacterium]|nr:GTPase domain-containing protein [Isosphaeraceae bacterium]